MRKMIPGQHRNNEKIRIVNVIEDARVSGPQRRIVAVSGILNNLSVETIVVFPNRESARFIQQLQRKNIEFKTIDLSKMSTTIIGMSRYSITFVFDVIRLKKLFIELRPDLVHASGGAWQYKAVIAAHLCAIPSVWHLNDTSMPGVIRYFFTIVARRFPTAFIVAAKSVENYYLKGRGYSQPVFRIPAPVDTEYLYRATKHEPLDICKIRLLMVGNITPVKGLEYLLQAIGLLGKNEWRFQLVLAGGRHNTQTEYLKKIDLLILQLSNIQVDFLGVVDDVKTLYEEADIFISPSVSEASPMAVWEAMSMECPLVSTCVGGVPEHIDNGREGILVEPSNAIAISEGLDVIISDYSAAIKRAKKARKRVVEELDLKSVVSMHKDCYETIITMKELYE